jgi:hypothetical protein
MLFGSDMNKKLAIVTMSFKDDFKECGLLCKSIDIFVGNEIIHYIIVNDEDYKLFQAYNYGQHTIRKISEILPKWLIRFPFKIAGHRFHVSPFTYPVRGWIIQQICKLGVFEIIDKDIDAVLNLDSESVFMRSFNYDYFVKNENYIMFKLKEIQLDSVDKGFCIAAKRLLQTDKDISSLSQHSYINEGVCFERKNLTELLNLIASNNVFGSWKMALCNTYRFSEYFLYGIYVDAILGGRNHFFDDKRIFPHLSIKEYNERKLFENKVKEVMQDDNVIGLWLQKTLRKKNSQNYLEFDAKKQIIESFWNL